MKIKSIFCILPLLFIIIPISAQTFKVSDFSDLQSAISVAEAISNENHLININGNIQFTSEISKALNLEINGINSETCDNK